MFFDILLKKEVKKPWNMPQKWSKYQFHTGVWNNEAFYLKKLCKNMKIGSQLWVETLKNGWFWPIFRGKIGHVAQVAHISNFHNSYYITQGLSGWNIELVFFEQYEIFAFLSKKIWKL